MQTRIHTLGFQPKVSSTLGLAVFLMLFANWVFLPQTVAAQEPTQEKPADVVAESKDQPVAEESPEADQPKSSEEAKASDSTTEVSSDDSNTAEEPKKKNKSDRKPEAEKAKASKPKAGKPEASKPKAGKPEASKPEASKSEASKSEENKPDEKGTDAQPEMKEATTDKSVVAKEDSAKPEQDAAGTEKALGTETLAEPKTPESAAVASPVEQVLVELAPAEPAKLPNIGSSATPMIPGQPWRVHDIRRPRPVVVTPGELSTYDKPGTAPSDAIVLFDGTDLSNWTHLGPDGPEDMRVAQWKVENGYMEVVPRTGTMQTIESFGSCQLHIEWQSPEKVKGHSQGRGNSGIKIMQVYEVQVLDSFNNRSYADGYAGAMYGQYPPMVNATRQPGEWQVYDIIFEAPKFKDDGSVDQPAYLTLMHNGVLLHHRRAFYGPTGGRMIQKYNLDSPAAPLTLQDHGNPVRFRNIWIRPLDL